MAATVILNPINWMDMAVQRHLELNQLDRSPSSSVIFNAVNWVDTFKGNVTSYHLLFSAISRETPVRVLGGRAMYDVASRSPIGYKSMHPLLQVVDVRSCMRIGCILTCRISLTSKLLYMLCDAAHAAPSARISGSQGIRKNRTQSAHRDMSLRDLHHTSINGHLSVDALARQSHMVLQCFNTVLIHVYCVFINRKSPPMRIAAITKPSHPLRRRKKKKKKHVGFSGCGESAAAVRPPPRSTRPPPRDGTHKESKAGRRRPLPGPSQQNSQQMWGGQRETRCGCSTLGLYIHLYLMQCFVSYE